MAEACEDCLREQLGILAESDYPLNAALQTPEPVYCVDGALAITPHKGMAGPVAGSTLWGATEIAAAGVGVEIAPAIENVISWVNETAYAVSVLVLTSGPLTFVRGSMSGTLAFAYQYEYLVSSPAVNGVVSESVFGLAGGSLTDPHAIQMVSQATYEIAAGGSIQIVPKVRYTTTGTATGRYMAGARMDVMMIGGAA